MIEKDSPYISAFTACGFLFPGFLRVLPLLMSPQADALRRDEVQRNAVMQVNSLASRIR